MVYAKHMTSQTDWPTTYTGNNGRETPQNFTIKAFDNKTERSAFLDEAWEKGENLISCTRKQVEVFFGKHFAPASDRVVVAMPQGDSYLLDRYEFALEESEQCVVVEGY